MPDYQYVGKHVKRVDGNAIVTGRTQFIDDLRLPGMLFARVLKSPYPHANILSINTDKAKALPGVKAVLTHETVPPWTCGLPQHRKVLDRRLRFVGDSVALVAATSIETANEALKLIEVEYEELSFVLDCEEALKKGAPLIWDQFENNEFTPGCPFFSPEPFKRIDRGDIAKGFEESDYIAEGYYCYDKFPHPLPPECPCVIANWTGPQALTLWYNGAAPHLQKINTEGSIFGTAVRVVAMHSGGSYGSKQLIPLLALQAAALAQATNKPVKLMMDKRDHFNSYEIRMGSRIRGRVGLTKDGIINALQGVWYVDSGMSSTYAQAQIAVGLGEAQVMLGKCANWDLDSKLVATNHIPAAPIRGFGGQELKSALIPLVCSVARKAKFDPVEIFKKNFAAAGDGYIWRDFKWWDVKSVNYVPCMEEAAKKFGWEDKWKGWEVPTSVKGNRAVGVGVGVHGNADIGEDPTEAFVKLHMFGSVTIECCIGETGGAQRHGASKMVAEVLKVPFESVQVVDADTHHTGYDAGLIGSRGTITIGTACVRAASDARNKLLGKASQMLHIPVEALDTENFTIFPKDNPGMRLPGMRLPWIAVTGTPEITITGEGVYEQNFDKPNFAIYFAEVEVNLDTGEAKLISALEGSDVGQIIDPINLKMQMEGSFGAAGADTALFEEGIIDKHTGRILNGNMIDYKWRTFNEFPKFDTVILESQFDSEAFRAVGFGEISGSPAPSAILMAVSNAIGVEVSEYPATPDVILRALGKAR